jgi:monofunctional biosynthetic peptidoglycan transglycosylase
VRGASTISQQVAKNLFLWSGRSYFRKGLEAYFTVLIETCWPKRRILEVYLNIAEFGLGTYGAEAAAQRYFHKPAARLTRSDAALLAAVLPNPKLYLVSAPSRYIEQRRAWILGQMQSLGGPEMLEEIDAYPARAR